VTGAFLVFGLFYLKIMHLPPRIILQLVTMSKITVNVYKLLLVENEWRAVS